MKYIIILFLGLFVVSGCAKISHLDQLLTLKGLADEQEQLKLYVEEQDEKFNLMLEEMKAGTLGLYLNKGKIYRTFGDPVYVKKTNKNDQEMEIWLYRYATEFFDSEKIYLTFDSNENLIETEYVGGEDGESR